MADWEKWFVRLRRIWRLVAIWAVCLPVSFIVGIETGFPGGQGSWIAIWVSGTLALGVLGDRIRCPRCRQKFYVDADWANAMTSKCLHCGLAIEDIVALRKKRLAEKR